MASGRIESLDAARGLAIAQMVAYHFLFDLGHFGWIRIDMYDDPGWIAWRGAIVSQFLLVMGFSLALREGGDGAGFAARFWRRWAQVAGCALLVSAGTAIVFGPRWIWFGVLHFAALAQLLVHGGRSALARFAPWPLALAGALVLALGNFVRFPAFGADALSWIGFSPRKPATEDFVPLLPWIGVVLLGFAAGRWWRRKRVVFALGPSFARARRRSAPEGPSFGGQRPAMARFLAAAGRWPLTIYMVHQPLLFGAMLLVSPRQP